MDKPRYSQNTELEPLRVDMELELLKVEFQVDSTWIKKSRHVHQNTKIEPLRLEFLGVNRVS